MNKVYENLRKYVAPPDEQEPWAFYSPVGIIHIEASKVCSAIMTDNWDEVHQEIINAGSITARDYND